MISQLSLTLTLVLQSGSASAQDTPLPPQAGTGAATATAPMQGVTSGADGSVASTTGQASATAAPAPLKPRAHLHGLATHDATYWGLPALAGLLGFLTGTALHANVVRREAAKVPHDRRDVLTLWGWSGAVLFMLVLGVGLLFAYWGLSDTSTRQLYSKHLPWPYVWLLLAFCAPVAFWLAASIAGKSVRR